MGNWKCLFGVLGLLVLKANAQEMPLSLSVGYPFVSIEATNVDHRRLITGEIRYQSPRWLYAGVSAYRLEYFEKSSGVSGWHKYYDVTRLGLGLTAGGRLPFYKRSYQQLGLSAGIDREERKSEINSGLPGLTTSKGKSVGYLGYAGFDLKFYFQSNSGIAAGVGFAVIGTPYDLAFAPVILVGYHVPLLKRVAAGQ